MSGKGEDRGGRSHGHVGDGRTSGRGRTNELCLHLEPRRLFADVSLNYSYTQYLIHMVVNCGRNDCNLWRNPVQVQARRPRRVDIGNICSPHRPLAI